MGVIFASGEMQGVRFSRAEMHCAFQQWRDAVVKRMDEGDFRQW